MHNEVKILLVEDDPNLGNVIKDYLKMKGFAPSLARNGEEGLLAWKKDPYDILILDVMMPKMDGFTLAKEIRKVDDKTPILFLTAKNMIEDKVEAYTIGGDDYLSKPFSMEELILRIKAILKRTQNDSSSSSSIEEFEIASYHFDYPRRVLTLGDKASKLTTREAELLKLLCLNKNEILSRENALKLIWGDDSYYNARSMDVFITRLRKYFKDSDEVQIMNEHGVGYRLIC